jgi:cobalt-zinc-cadmium efflux system membrane fusion protein
MIRRRSHWLLAGGLAATIAVFVILASRGQHAGASQGEAKQTPAAPPKLTTPKDEIRLAPAAQQQGGIEALVAQTSSMPETVVANGVLAVNEDRTWHVSSYMLGRVTEADAKVGDFVEAGQVLARMHSHEVHDSRAAYQQAVAALTDADAQKALKEKALNRADRLFRLQAISQGQLEQADADLKKAEAMVASSTALVQREKTHLTEVLHVPINPDPKDERAELVPIESPSRGVVIERLASVGTVVTPGSPMFTIADVSSLWLIASVNEIDLHRVRVGRPVDIGVGAYPEHVFRGTTSWLGESLDPSTRTLQVRVLVPNPGGVLKPQMYVTANFLTSGSRPAIVIPQTALQDLNGQHVVFIQTSADTFRPRIVVPGSSHDGQVEITQGLQRGDRVIVKGSYGLKSEMLKSSLVEGE